MGIIRYPAMNLKGLMTLIMGLTCVSESAWASGTTLTFDDVATGALSTQYQNLGVTVSGAIVVDAAFSSWPAHSGTQIAFSPSGLMTFTLDPKVAGNIESISVYISGTNTGLFAYDASNNLVGQAQLPPGAPPNTLLSLSTSGNSIVTVLIHDGGSSFAIDDFAFSSMQTCSQVSQTLHDAVTNLPDHDFVWASWARTERELLLRGVSRFRDLQADEASENHLLQTLYFIDWHSRKELKAGKDQSFILGLENQLIQMTKAGVCTSHMNSGPSPEFKEIQDERR